MTASNPEPSQSECSAYEVHAETENSPSSSTRSFQRHTVVFSATLFAAMAMVCVFGPIANLCSKWAFILFSYPVPPSEITPDMEPVKYDDNIAQVMFKHFTTLIWCAGTYFVDSRVLFPKGKNMIFADQDTLRSHRSLPAKTRQRIILLSAVPALCDFGFSVFQSGATKMIRTSTVQMIANFNVLVVSFFNMLILKKAITMGQWIAIGIVLIGVILSGLDGILYPDINSSIDSNAILAVGYVIMAVLLRSFGVTVDQIILSDYKIPLFKLYAIEQCFAVSAILITMLIKFICGSNDFVDSFWDYVNNPTIFAAQLSHGVSACLFNSAGIWVGLLSNPIFRILTMSTRTITSWFVELAIGWNHFEWITLWGQLTLGFGIVLYSGVLFPATNLWLRRPWTLGGRLTPPPEAVLTEKQIRKLELYRSIKNRDKTTKKLAYSLNVFLTQPFIEARGLPTEP